MDYILDPSKTKKIICDTYLMPLKLGKIIEVTYMTSFERRKSTWIRYLTPSKMKKKYTGYILYAYQNGENYFGNTQLHILSKCVLVNSTLYFHMDMDLGVCFSNMDM